jgi:multimeric flavodoxin WrbA
VANGSTVLGLVGSPNPEGRTNRLVRAALEGAAKAGAPVELIQMSEHVAGACKDCISRECQSRRHCSFDDAEFEYLAEKIIGCGALVLGTPVYWWDTTGMVKYLILKMFRVHAPAAPLQGLPAVGIGVAGGTGNGLVSGLRPVYHFFQMMQMRAIEPLPVTRFNIESAVERADVLGAQLARMAKERQPFAGVEDRLLWYDALPYLSLSRVEERRLLADQATLALPEDADPSIAKGLATADALLAQGRQLESQVEVTRVYTAGVKAFEKA